MSVQCCWCGVRKFTFWHDPVKQFVNFAARTTKYFKQIICIVRNVMKMIAKALDAQFILNYIVEKTETEKSRVILNKKIVVMTIRRAKFIESVNYRIDAFIQFI